MAARERRHATPDPSRNRERHHRRHRHDDWRVSHLRVLGTGRCVLGTERPGSTRATVRHERVHSRPVKRHWCHGGQRGRLTSRGPLGMMASVRCWGDIPHRRDNSATGPPRPRLMRTAGSRTHRRVAIRPVAAYFCGPVDGTVRCWARRVRQIGDGTTTRALAAVMCAEWPAAVGVPAVVHHICALLATATARLLGH